MCIILVHINLTNILIICINNLLLMNMSFHFHLPSCLSHASTFYVIWSPWSSRLASPRLPTLATHYLCFTSTSSTSFNFNLYFHLCSPEFSPFRPSSDSSSSSSHNAQNSHHEDKPKGTKTTFTGTIVKRLPISLGLSDAD